MENIKNEIWYTIPNYEGFYELSSLNRIKSLCRIVKHRTGTTMIVKEKILSQSVNKSGHLFVSLNKEGNKEVLGIHVIVARVHIPNPLNLPLVEHLDDIPSNNQTENLKWSTYSSNTKNSYRLNKSRLSLIQGEKNKSSILIKHQVLEIRSSNLKPIQLAKKYNVGKTTIYNIINKRTWVHI